MLGAFGFVGYLLFAGGLIIAAVCPLLALRPQRQIVQLIEAACAQSEESD